MIWTTTRGACEEGQFVTTPGAAYNAIAAPLGVSAPECVSIENTASVRCCGDASPETSACSTSSLSCAELGWPRLDGANYYSAAACFDNRTVIMPPNFECPSTQTSAELCQSRLSRKCTANEIDSARRMRPDLTGADCICCADYVVKRNPCQFPYLINLTNTTSAVDFVTNRDHGQRCFWALQGCSPAESLKLSFVNVSMPRNDQLKIYGSKVGLAGVSRQRPSSAALFLACER